MPRGPRYLPPGWSVEVSTRTICGFYLLPANSQFTRIMVGILAKAQEKYPVQVHTAVDTSNHYHLTLTPKDLEQLADFMEFFNGNLAREAGRLMGWRSSKGASRVGRVGRWQEIPRGHSSREFRQRRMRT